MEISKIRILVTRAGEMQGPTIVDLPMSTVFRMRCLNGKTRKAPTFSALQSPSGPRGLMQLPPNENSNLKYQYRLSVEDPRPFF